MVRRKTWYGGRAVKDQRQTSAANGRCGSDCGGDRQLNRALHTIIVSRRKSHAPTIAYIARKTREGKSVREAIRCLKRHVARHIYRVLERTAMTA
jgi:hypothetical protein